jgi:hypothetical protein
MMALLVGMAALAVINLWPVFQAVPATEPEPSVEE